LKEKFRKSKNVKFSKFQILKNTLSLILSGVGIKPNFFAF